MTHPIVTKPRLNTDELDDFRDVLVGLGVEVDHLVSVGYTAPYLDMVAYDHDEDGTHSPLHELGAPECGDPICSHWREHTHQLFFESELPAWWQPSVNE